MLKKVDRHNTAKFWIHVDFQREKYKKKKGTEIIVYVGDANYLFD